MSKYKWIAENGICGQNEIIASAAKYCDEDAIYIALYTDKAEIGQTILENLNRIDGNNLMELRIFNSKREFFAIRSMCTEDFKWRVTSDKNLKKEDYIVRHQFIDINKVKSMGKSTFFQIDERVNSVKVISYIEYDEYGMAKVVDNRVCQLEEME